MKFVLLFVCVISCASSIRLYSQAEPETPASSSAPATKVKPSVPGTFQKKYPKGPKVELSGIHVKPTAPGPKEFEWTNTNKPLDIKTEEGKIFKILIKGNITTGYNWFLMNPKNIGILNALNLEKEGSSKDYRSDKSDKGRLGVGGVHIFSFRANKIGKTTLQFIQKGPGEGDGRMVKRAVHIVNVSVN